MVKGMALQQSRLYPGLRHSQYRVCHGQYHVTFHVGNTQARTGTAAFCYRTSLLHCWRMAAIRAFFFIAQ